MSFRQLPQPTDWAESEASRDTLRRDIGARRAIEQVPAARSCECRPGRRDRRGVPLTTKLRSRPDSGFGTAFADRWCVADGNDHLVLDRHHPWTQLSLHELVPLHVAPV